MRGAEILIFLLPFVLYGMAVIYDECRGFCAARGGGMSFSAAVRLGGSVQMHGIR